MDPSYNFYFTDNCAYSEANPRVFVEKNFSGSILIDNKEIRFPENIYSASNDTYIFKYEDTVFLSQEEAIVHYSLNEIESYKDGIALYSITYTKSSSPETEHEIRTPQNNILPAYNKTPLILPITDFNQSPFEVNYSSFQSIYNALKSNLELIIDTSYDNGDSVTYSSFPFSSSNFTQYSIETLPGKYKVTFRFQDSNLSVIPSGYIVIVVNKTPVLNGNIVHLADLNINTLSCCKDNPTLQSFMSESSSNSSSSNSSNSSSSNSSSSSSSSSSSLSSNSSSSSSRDSWPPQQDLWALVNNNTCPIIITYNGLLYGIVNRDIYILSTNSNDTQLIYRVPSNMYTYELPSITFGICIGDNVYLGNNIGFYGRDAFFKYNIPTNQLTRLSNRPNNYSYTSFGRYDSNRIIMMGGYYDLGNDILRDKYMWVYNINTDSWTRTIDFPEITYTGKIISITNIENVLYFIKGSQSWSIYKLENNNWSIISPLPDFGDANNQSHAGVNYYGVLYAGAGSSNAQKWYRYNSDYNQWTALSPFPHWQGAFNQNNSVVIGRYIYVASFNYGIWRYG
jgi:hypothetical protein